MAVIAFHLSSVKLPEASSLKSLWGNHCWLLETVYHYWWMHCI